MNISAFLSSVVKRVFLSKETDLEVNKLPLYQFKENEVEYIFYTTNNMIKTHMGYFRFCWRHESWHIQREKLTSFYNCIDKSRILKGTSLEVFLKSEYESWLSHRGFCKYQTYNSNRSMSESLIYSMLTGGGTLLTSIEFCRIKIGDGMELMGTMSATAPGVDVRVVCHDFEGKVTCQLLLDLNTLNLIDVICHELDHRPGNYTIVMSEDKAISICAFDNDSPWAFNPSSSVNFNTYKNASPIILDGKVNRSCFNADVVARFLALKQSDIKSQLQSYLNCLQLQALWCRIQKLQKAFENGNFNMVATEDCIKQELSGKYGRTYLAILCDVCNKIDNGLL